VGKEAAHPRLERGVTMSFWKKLTKIFAAPPSSMGRVYNVTVKCKRCGEIIEGRVNLEHDLSVTEYTSNDAPAKYHSRKVLMGTGQCFQKIEIEMTFDNMRRLKEKTITGGEFVE
jgi:hypothetical protein